MGSCLKGAAEYVKGVDVEIHTQTPSRNSRNHGDGGDDYCSQCRKRKSERHRVMTITSQTVERSESGENRKMVNNDG